MRSTYDRLIRSSRPEVFFKNGVLRKFAEFTGKHLFQSLFLNKVTGTGVFRWILRNFYEQALLKNTSGGCFWFMEFLIETYSKCFSCFWIFSASWALPNMLSLAFHLVNQLSFNSCWILKMFWIVFDGNVKTSSYLN